jgi:hypothetical protein
VGDPPAARGPECDAVEVVEALLGRLERVERRIAEARVVLDHVIPDDLVEELARVGVEERAVRVKRAILDRDWNLSIGLVRRERVVLPGCRPGEGGRSPGSRVEDGVSRASADEVEAGRARIDVEPRHAERVIVVPDRRGPVLVRVLEGREAGAPLDAVGAFCLRGENSYQVPSSRSPQGCHPRPAGTTPPRSRRCRRRLPPHRARGSRAERGRCWPRRGLPRSPAARPVRLCRRAGSPSGGSGRPAGGEAGSRRLGPRAR